MGLFSGKLVCKEETEEFVKLVKALDNDEEWASEKMKEICKDNPKFVETLDLTRMSIYRESAELGNADAQYWMGFSMRNIDEKESFKWYTMAAIGGDAVAQYKVGIEFIIGKVVKQDYDKAIEWFSLSAAQKYPRGMNEFAEQLISNKVRVTKPNDWTEEKWKEQLNEWDEQAIKLYREVTQLDDYDACIQAIKALGWIHQNKYSANFDIELALYSFYFVYYRNDQSVENIIAEIERAYKDILTDEQVSLIKERAKP